jgi:flagellar protein FlaG
MIIQNTINIGQAVQPGLQVGEQQISRVATTPPAAATTAAEPTPQQLKHAVDSINKSLQPSASNLEFNIDPGTQRAVVKVVDTSTGDVIRQIPSKEVLAIAESIDQLNKGLLLSQKA